MRYSKSTRMSYCIHASQRPFLENLTHNPLRRGLCYDCKHGYKQRVRSNLLCAPKLCAEAVTDIAATGWKFKAKFDDGVAFPIIFSETPCCGRCPESLQKLRPAQLLVAAAAAAIHLSPVTQRVLMYVNYVGFPQRRAGGCERSAR